MTGAMLFAGIFLGLAVLVNFIFIVNKFKNGRYLDAATDIAIILLASSLYGASVMGGVIATIGSMFISMYLHWKPLDLSLNKPTPVEDLAGDGWTSKIDSMFK